MEMKMKSLCVLALLMGACSGKQVGGESATDTLALKKAAAEAAAHESSGSGSPTTSTEDPCAAHAWYGDGECDSFCAQHDTDCVPDGSGTPTVCAQFIELADGKCLRAGADPCRFQDADCGGVIPPIAGDGGGMVACATISEVSDGVCKRADSDPCRFQDPDCTSGGGNDGNPGAGGGGSGGDSGSAGNTGGGVACPAIIEISNGKCERPASDPCRSIDPDCNVACATFVEQPDGECKRDPNDPCLFQDPDCKAK